MVLEEATTAQEPAVISEEAPASDLDRYSSNSSGNTAGSSNSISFNQPFGNERLTINLENVPLPIFSIYSRERQRRAFHMGVYRQVVDASTRLQRPLRQEEADALSQHFGAGLRVASFGTPIGVFVATLLAYRQKDGRFPGWSPFKSGRFQPDVFAMFRGSQARFIWTAARYATYGLVGWALGSLFFSAYAVTLHSTNRLRDPRLKDLNERLRQQMQGKMMERQRPREDPGRREGETLEMSRQRQVAQRQAEGFEQRQRTVEPQRRQNVDDASPTGGAYADEFMNTSSDTGLMTDNQTRDQQSRAENATSTYDTGESRSRFGSSSTSRQFEQPTQSNDAPAPGAWDRLRKEAMSGQSGPSSQPGLPRQPPAPGYPSRTYPTQAQRSGSQRENAPTQTSSQSEESFNFSQSEEDKQLARSEAQSRFDARIEQEREGKDFDEGSGGGRGRRW